jgi:hypothetical protein
MDHRPTRTHHEIVHKVARRRLAVRTGDEHKPARNLAGKVRERVGGDPFGNEAGECRTPAPREARKRAC